MRGRWHWKEEEERRCRVYQEGEESVTHVLRECQKTRGDMEPKEFLNKKGVGLEIMKRIMEERQREIQENEEQRESAECESHMTKPGVNGTQQRERKG